MAASFSTGFPSTFGRFEKAGFECPTGYSTASATPFGGNFGGNVAGYPWSNFGTSSTFGGYPTEWSSRFGGNSTGYPWANAGNTSFGGYPWTNEWTSSYPWARFGGNFGGYESFPWSRFGGNFGGFESYPWSRFGGEYNTYPWSRYGGNFGGFESFPWSRFGGEFNSYPWSRFGGNFGGFESYPWSRFGGEYNTYPWSRFGGNFGGYESFPWSRFGGEFNTYPWSRNFGGFESYPWSRFGGEFNAYPWSRFGGELTSYPWTRDFSSRYTVPSSWFGNNFDWANWERTNFEEFDRSLSNATRELFNLKNLFDFGKRREATSGNRGAFSTSMVQLPSRPTSSIEYYTFQNPIRFDAYGNRWLSLCFDLPSYKPEEIKVTLYSKANPAYIEVLASHDVKDTKEHNVKRTYERKYFFPADLNLKAEDIAKLEVKSHFSNDGCLYVEAQLPRLTIEEMRKERTAYPVWSVPIKTEKKDI